MSLQLRVRSIPEAWARATRHWATGERLRGMLPELIVTALVCALLMVKLHIPSLIGIADTGDYGRLMQPLGLHDLAPPKLLFNYYVNQFYSIGQRGPIEYPSSALVVLWPAVRLSAVLHHGIFDLALAGFFYEAMFLFGVFLLVRGVRRLAPARWLVVLAGLLLLVIFTDTAFVAYFHSLYSEPASYTCLLLTVGALLNLVADARPDYFMLAIFTTAGAGLATAKTQDLPLVLPLALFCVWLARLRAESRWRLLVGLSCGFIAVMGIIAFVRTPSGFRQENAYESTFLGILHDDTPAQARSDLQALGVDPRYAYLADKPFYIGAGWLAQKNPAFVADFYGHVNQLTIVEFYVTHPARLLPGLGISADAAMALRPNYLGNFTASAGMPERALSYRLDLWSALTEQVLPRSPWFLFVFFGGYLVALIYEYRAAATPRARALVALCGLVGTWAVLEFVMVYVADGTYEIVKHLYIYDALVDLAFAIALLWAARQGMRIVSRIASRIASRRTAASRPAASAKSAAEEA